MKIIISILFFFSLQIAISNQFDNLKKGSDYSYILRLNNGDILSGSIIDFISDKANGDGIKLKTEIGNAIIYNNQILDITLSEDYYRHNHRIFLMPTANPIQSNHYTGFFEILFLQAGAGISNFFSFTAGTTLIPSIPNSNQSSNFNTKFTFYDEYFSEVDRGVTLAVGGNLAFANSSNRLIHIYSSGTFKLPNTQLTANVFYKAGSQDYFTFLLKENISNVIYPDGAFGVSLGLDHKLLDRNDLHIIGELWNIDVNRPTNSAILLGLRLCNRNFSADFGFALFTNPYLVPFTSFTWTPF